MTRGLAERSSAALAANGTARDASRVSPDPPSERGARATRSTTKVDGKPSFQFYPNDYLTDQALRLCGLAARGLWWDMVCFMWNSPRRGFLLKPNGSKVEAKDLAKLCGETVDEVAACLAELGENEVYSTDPEGVIYSRRMVREAEAAARLSEVRAEAGRKGGLSKGEAKHEAKSEANTIAKQAASSSSSSSSSTSLKNTVASDEPTQPAAPTKNKKSNTEREAPWHEWHRIVAEDMRGHASPAQIAYVTDELKRCLSEYYSARGGRLTPTRLGFIGENFLKFDPQVGLVAAEVFCDRVGGSKDEKYLVGIARRLEKATPDEFAAELKRHRESYNGRGVWSGRPRA